MDTEDKLVNYQGEMGRGEQDVGRRLRGTNYRYKINMITVYNTQHRIQPSL